MATEDRNSTQLQVVWTVGSWQCVYAQSRLMLVIDEQLVAVKEVDGLADLCQISETWRARVRSVVELEAQVEGASRRL